MVEFKLGRRCLPLYVVIDVRLRKEKEKEKKSEKERKEKERKKDKSLKKKRTKRVLNKSVLISFVFGVKFVIKRKVGLKLYCLKLCGSNYSLRFRQVFVRLALGLITCLLTEPHYNLKS